MPECHKCSWNGKGSQHCLSCKETPQNLVNYGKTHVSLTTMPDFETITTRIVDFLPEENSDYDKLVSIFNLTISAILSLPSKDRDIICLRWKSFTEKGHSYREIGREFSLSPQAVEIRLRNILRNYPILKVLFMIKCARHRRKEANERAR